MRALAVPLTLAALVGCGGERATLHGQRIGVAGLARQALYADHAPPELVGVRIGDGSGTSEVRVVALTPALRTETGPVEHWCATVARSCSDWVPSGRELTVVLPDQSGEHVVHLWARDTAGNISLPVSSTVRLEVPELARR